MLAALGGDGADRMQWTEGGIGFGCRRPAAMARACATSEHPAGIAIAADVRLDARDALCDTLGAPRAEVTDVDLLLLAYQRWGRECPKHLLGDYAFALWDARAHTLFCARDHIGARPFYYAPAPARFVFASTVEAVLAAPGVSSELDEATVATYLSRVHPDTTARTFFRSVRKLPPGHTLTVEGGCVRVERHWRPENAPRARPASDDAHAEEFLELYAQAVKDRLRGPGPVGAHLSGGLDSSSIAVLAARELRRQGRPPPLAFSWLPAPDDGPPSEAHAPEYALIDAVCRREGLQVFHRSPSAGDIVDVLRRDGAFPGVHVQLNEEVVQRCAAEQGVRVILSGWGGDEGVSFNGRGHVEHLLLSGRWATLRAELRARGANPLRFLAGVSLRLAHPSLAKSVRRWRQGKEPLHRRWLIDPAFARRAKPLPIRMPRYMGVRRTQLLLLRGGHLSERMEGWAASGARRGIEYRYPLLDRRLLEFALGLPAEQFRRGKWSRWLMRHALGTLPAGETTSRAPNENAVLPPEICWNPSKEDPARQEPLMDAFAEALPAVRKALAAPDMRPSRSRYIDMPRLMKRLDTGRFRAKPQFAPLHNALQFLDFRRAGNR